MYRQGKYTRKRGPVVAAKRLLKRSWAWWKELPRWKKIVYPSAPIVAFLIIVPVVTYAYYYNYIADIDKLLNKNNTGVVLLDRHGKAFYSTGKAEHRDQVKLKDISDNTTHALLAAEDKDFYNHGGFSVAGYGRAVANIVTKGSINGGGSTLTLQLAKNTLLTGNQNFFRKYQELTIAVAIEQRYSKDEILEMYLNSVYYGENAFGIEEAAETYFDKKPSELTVAESAMIVGVLPAPSTYSPISGVKKYAKERQEYVLGRMVEDGYITKAQETKALKTKLHYAKQKNAIDNSAPHFTEMVLNQLYKDYGEETVERSGYQVKTTLDLKTQKIANKAVANHRDYIQANGGSNASVTVIDPKNGQVRALVGSVDYDNKKFGNVNMSTTSRQPGSSFKPIYVSQAMADGVITPATVFKDEYTDFGGGYTPQNASRSFYGNVTVRQALGWSLNIPSVKIMQQYGVSRAIKGAEKLGITTIDEKKDYGLAFALGVAEVPAIEMTNAYAAFANGGEQYDTSIISSIEDKFDKTVYTASNESHRAISEQGAYLISNILSDNANRSRIFGTTLNVTGTDYQTKTVAVKTGTTEDSRDAWTIGYTPNTTVGVWVGNNDNAPMNNGGSSMAGPIWQEIISQLIGTSKPEFVQPAGITKATVCTDIGSVTDVFLSSRIPKQCAAEKKTQTKTTKKKTTPKETQTDENCTVAGKETLKANDPECAEEFCTIEGLENLAANDPKCVDPTQQDDDSDGVVNDQDTCPDTTSGDEVDENGCSQSQLDTSTDPTKKKTGSVRLPRKNS